MSDRHRSTAPDVGEIPTPADPSTSPQHYISQRPLLLVVLVGAGSPTGCSLILGFSSAGSFPSVKLRAPELAVPSATSSPTAAVSPAPLATVTATATDGVPVGQSLEEKVGQLMMVGADAQVPKQSSNEAVDTHHVGNIFIVGCTTVDSRTIQKVIGSFTPKVGLGTTHATLTLMAADQKGGEVQVLAGSGFSDTPSALDQSAQPYDQLVASARTWGRGLADVGVNTNLAPVVDLVDIARPASNGPIGRQGREYGHGVTTASSQAGAFAEGMQASKVVPIYKHSPGLGRVKDNADTSAGIVDSTMTHSADTVASVIFGAAIATGVPVIMVSLVTYFLVDPSAPAVFSSTIVTDMLRREMGFSGVVITDDISAAVQVRDASTGDRAVRAIRVGCDVVLTPADPTVAMNMVKVLISTARSGPTFAAQVDESATWVLNLKESPQS